MSETKQRSTESLEQVVTELQSAFGCLLSAIDRAPIDRTDDSGVCGDWLLKTLLGHIAYWHRFEAERIAHRSEMGEIDWQSANVMVARETTNLMYGDPRAELADNHKRLVAVIQSDPNLAPELVRELTHDHDVEHAGEIERWIAQQAQL